MPCYVAQRVEKERRIWFIHFFKGCLSELQKKKKRQQQKNTLMSNNLIWCCISDAKICMGLPGGEAITVSAPRSSKQLHDHLDTWGEGTKLRDIPQTQSAWKLMFLLWNETRDGQTPVSPGAEVGPGQKCTWAVMLETEERVETQEAIPLVSSLTFTNFLLESKTSFPVHKTPHTLGTCTLALPHPLSVRKPVSRLLHCKI